MMNLVGQLVTQHFVLLFITAMVFLALIIAVAVFLFVQFQRNPTATWRTVMLELSVARKVRRVLSRRSTDGPAQDLSGTIAPGELNIKDIPLPPKADKPGES